MSKPMRYYPAFEPGRGSNFNGFEVSMREDSTGDWVSYSDYAALAAENERLRKAGDAMYDFAVQDSLGYWLMPPFQRWSKEHHSRNAAKEGGAK